MCNILDTSVNIEARTNLLIFVVDTSRGMAGENPKFMVDKLPNMAGNGIDAARRAIEEVSSNIQTILKKCNLAQIEITVLAFSKNAKWVSDVKNLNAEECEAKFSAACEKLNDKLSERSELPPAIIILASNEPYYDDYSTELEILKSNEEFNHAFKEAVIWGGDTNKDVLSDTGFKEIKNTYQPDIFIELVREKSYKAVFGSGVRYN
jgi:hypothetical protein